MLTSTFDAYYNNDLVFTAGDLRVVTNQDAYKNVLKFKTSVSQGDFLADPGLGSTLIRTLANLPVSASNAAIQTAITSEITKSLFYNDPFLAALAQVVVSVASTPEKTVTITISFSTNQILPSTTQISFVQLQSNAGTAMWAAAQWGNGTWQ